MRLNRIVDPSGGGVTRADGGEDRLSRTDRGGLSAVDRVVVHRSTGVEGITVPAAEPEPISVMQALHSTPSRRFLSTEPIPDEVVWAILDAAVRGPPGQPAILGLGGGDRSIDQGADRARGTGRAGRRPTATGATRSSAPQPRSTGSEVRRSFLAAEYLAEHLEDAPVWVFPVLRQAAGATNPRLGSSIYGAVQQLILAARAFGIGTTLTSLYVGHEDDVRELLGLPPDALTMALAAFGLSVPWPVGRAPAAAP